MCVCEREGERERERERERGQGRGHGQGHGGWMGAEARGRPWAETGIRAGASEVLIGIGPGHGRATGPWKARWDSMASSVTMAGGAQTPQETGMHRVHASVVHLAFSGDPALTPAARHPTLQALALASAPDPAPDVAFDVPCLAPVRGLSSHSRGPSPGVAQVPQPPTPPPPNPLTISVDVVLGVGDLRWYSHGLRGHSFHGPRPPEIDRPGVRSSVGGWGEGG